MPTFHVFLALTYPIALMWFTGYALPLLFPLTAGFALVGPFAGLVVRDEPVPRAWPRHLMGARVGRGALAIDFIDPVARSVAACDFCVLGIRGPISFHVPFWNRATKVLHSTCHNYFATPEGWTLIGLGSAIGFVFAVVALSISVVSFPLLLDRDVGPWWRFRLPLGPCWRTLSPWRCGD